LVEGKLAMKKVDDDGYRRNDEYYPRLSEKYYWEFDRHSKDGPLEWAYYIQKDEEDYHITADGVSVTCEDGSWVHTNIVPRTLFPECSRELTEDQIFKILEIPVEGRCYSKEEMTELFEEWRRLGEL
jgi:hypothetical protein